MERITEKDYPLLRDLQWNGRLYDNPATVKMLKKLQLRAHNGGLITDYFLGIDAADDGRKDCDWVLRSINEGWPVLAPLWRNTVDLLSEAFVLAVMETSQTFAKDENKELLCDYLKNRTFSGTLLIPHFGMLICYHLSFGPNGEQTACDIMETDRHGSVVIYFNGTSGFVSNSFKFVNAKNGKTEDIARGIDRDLLAIEQLEDFVKNYVLFCRFAQVRTKYIAREGTRDARKPSTDMVSTCSLPVRRMFEDYFANIIRTEGFSVKGHFRLQPCGPGFSDHKLIYIKPFEKHGYTKKAKVVQQVED